MKTHIAEKLTSLLIIMMLVLGATSLASAATTVNDTISKDTTWKARKSPYVVTENILLEHGATLTIEPGVRVELEADKKIEVRGKFIAIGTVEKPIIFTAHDEVPWDTLYFTDFSDDAKFSRSGEYLEGCILKHCIIEKGRGVYVRFGAPLITECIIQNNVTSGIRVEFGGPRIVKNHIKDNSTEHDSASGNGGGIIAYTDKDVLIADNTISNNVSDGGRDGGGGIYVYGSGDGLIEVKNNTIFGNTSSRFGGGIYSYNSVVSHNTIIDNTAAERGGGIYAVESELAGNIIQSNTALRGGGICAENSDIESNSIVRNSASRPEGGALYYFGSSTVHHNCIVSNTASGELACGGVYVSGNPDISENNFFNNSGFALYVANVADAPEVSAAENFWGTPSDKAILRLIYDWLDDENSGLARFVPFRETIAADTPPPPPFNLMISLEDAGIRLSWEEPVGRQFDGHRVYVGSTSGYPYETVIETGPETSYVLSGIEPRGEYWIAVTGYTNAEDGEIETGLSEETHLMLADSSAATVPTVSGSSATFPASGSGSVVLKTASPAKGAGIAASRWQISAFPGDFTALAIDTVTTGNDLYKLSLADTALAKGYEYFWRVAHLTSAGTWSEWSSPASFRLADADPSVLSGPLATMTLQKRLSPYRMMNNTLVMMDATLTIEPGVKIRIAPGKNLLVRGSIVARGTESEPIVFTQDSSEPWGRILLAGTSQPVVLNEDGSYKDGCVLEQCIVEHGSGIIVKSAWPLIKGCTIAHNNGSGIAVRQGGPIIVQNDIHDNSALTNGGGIYAYTNDTIHVTSNKIHDNQADGDGGGVFAYGYMNTSTIHVDDNDIYSNTATGDGGGVYLSRSSATNNRIKDNRADGDGGGIYSTFGLVKANDFNGNRANRGGGVFAEQNSSITDNSVVRNMALSGRGGGAYINFWGTSIENEVFSGNTVTGNRAPTKRDNGGVFVIGYLFFERNNVHGNDGSQLYNGNESGSSPLMTPECYWGTADRNVIALQIIDGSDDPKLGPVEFEPFAAEPLRFE